MEPNDPKLAVQMDVWASRSALTHVAKQNRHYEAMGKYCGMSPNPTVCKDEHKRDGGMEHAWERVFAIMAGSPDRLEGLE